MFVHIYDVSSKNIPPFSINIRELFIKSDIYVKMKDDFIQIKDNFIQREETVI